MTDQVWEPWCARPSGLVVPSRIDAAGESGPTRGMAEGPRWFRCVPWWYVPTDRPDVVEQVILEQSVRVRETGAVTGWAALRWHGARYFDGVTGPDRTPLPVPLVIGTTSSLKPFPGSVVSKAQLPHRDREEVGGIPVATVARALFDEVVRREQLWPGVQAIDMTAAAGLITVAQFVESLEQRSGWTGVPIVRDAASLAIDLSRSPRETWLRLVWLLALGWPPPLVNQPLFTVDGRLIGIPDLFDEEAGLAAEYNGEYHEGSGQTKKDKDREVRFRDAGLEYVESVRGDRVGDAASRLHSARARARSLPADQRAWTLEQPSWWRARNPTARSV